MDAVDVERHQTLLDVVTPHEGDLVAADSTDAWKRRYRRLYRRLYAWEDSIETRRSLRVQLRYVNAPATIRRGHGAHLVGDFRGGGDTSHVGPDSVAGWYDRNLRIFRNLQRRTRGPAERVLVVYGAGHPATRRHLVESSPEYRPVDAERYLGGR